MPKNHISPVTVHRRWCTVLTVIGLFALFCAAGCASGGKRTPPPALRPETSPPITRTSPPEKAKPKIETRYIKGLSVLTPQPQESAVKPGLTVSYYHKFFDRTLRMLPKRRIRKSEKPILELNHAFGRNEVFNSGVNRGIGMRMKGMVRFPAAGEYAFQALSNDGIRVYLSDRLVIDDPDQHADRLSDIAVFQIPEPAWYPLTVEYFQRKGTAAIKLFWREPGAADFRIVPAAAYGHVPGSE